MEINNHLQDGTEGVFPAAYVKLTGDIDFATAAEESAKWEAIVASAKVHFIEIGSCDLFACETRVCDEETYALCRL